MQSLILNFKLMSKPRGNFNKYGGSINAKKFTEYRDKVLEQINLQFMSLEQIQYEYYIGGFYQYMTGKGSGNIGRLPDIDNLLGGVVDCIVKSKCFKDDSMKYWEGKKFRSNIGKTNKAIILIGNEYEIEEIDKMIDELKRQSLINSLSNINRTVDLRYKLRA